MNINTKLILAAALLTMPVGFAQIPTDATPTPAEPAVRGERDLDTPTKPSTPADPIASIRPPRWVPSSPGPWNATLRAARSKDGLVFKRLAEPKSPFAHAPTLVRLPDDRLLMVFEHYSRADRRDFGGLAAVQSTDEGKTWSPPRPLRTRGLSRRVGPPRGPALAGRPDGRFQLVFVCTDRKQRRAILAAESGDGADFRVTARLKPAREDLRLDDLSILYIQKKCHLFGTVIDVAGQRYHGVSPSGRRFRRLENIHTAVSGTQGGLLAVDSGYRFYATSPAGVVSASSADAVRWTRDAGLRLPGASDPAVIQTKDGAYLMIYVDLPPGARGDGRRDLRTDRQPDPADPRGPAETPEQIAELAQQNDWWDYEDTPGEETTDFYKDLLEPVDSAETDEDTPIAPPPDDRVADAEAAAGQEPADDPPLNEPIDAADPSQGANPLAPVSQTPAAHPDPDPTADDPDYEPDYTESGVPIPDFRHRIDYRDWIQQRHDPDSVADNAYPFYAGLVPDPDRDDWERGLVRNLDNMFNDPEHEGPPGPWDPARHPQWEQSHHDAADILAQFADAMTHEDDVRPLSFPKPDADAPQDKDLADLLLNARLPHLPVHRKLVRQALADAWRAPDGKPDPQAMLDAFETSLDSAEHLAGGDFLIEDLVSIAEKAMVQENARWALKRGVFSEPDIEATLELLVARDLPQAYPGHTLDGEIASSFDVTQHLFTPAADGRDPVLDSEAIARFNALFDTELFLPPPTPEVIAATSADRVTDNFLEYYDTYHNMAARGYPDVTAADLDEMARPFIDDNYLSRALLPSLSRVYSLMNRQEASRRSTQLTFAIHLHKARTGQWPATLNDLPPRYTDTVRTDPFSGHDFVYRLTKEGFTLYSTSENGQDDGGSHNPRWGDNKEQDQPDDHVFWPPHHR